MSQCQVQVQALTFDCEGDELVGILHRPSGRPARVGVIVVDGGSHYRVGSHRQYVRTALELAAASFLRTSSGMGASEGYTADTLNFLSRMRDGLRRTMAPVRIQISELDLTASEFLDITESTKACRSAPHRTIVSLERLPWANRTFASSDVLRRSSRSASDWLHRTGSSNNA